MQFYNSEISKDLDKLEQEFNNLDKDARVYTQIKFNDYVAKNKRYSRKEFNETMKKELDFTKYLQILKDLPDDLNKKNIEELEETMKAHGKERKKIYHKEEIDTDDSFDDLLKFFESYYKFYEQMIADWSLIEL